MQPLTSRDHVLGRANRGPWQSGPADPPPSCPTCSSPLEAGPSRDGLVGVCATPHCPEWVVIFRRLEDRLVIAERIARQAGCAAACAAPAGAAG